jgi:hypothetical protein
MGDICLALKNELIALFRYAKIFVPARISPLGGFNKDFNCLSDGYVANICIPPTLGGRCPD